MKLKRQSAVLAVVAASAVMLAACGSDNNSGAAGAQAAGKSANVACGGKKTLKASGSTAQANAMSRFTQAFGATCSDQDINYNGNGSGAGVKEFIGKQTDFAGSDSALSAEKGEIEKAKQRCGAPAWNLPMVFGPIAITYKLDGVNDLALDGKTLAGIFSGKITKWNAPEIAKLNAGKKLPDQKITVIFRSDESGTTDNFQKYLKTAGGWDKGTGKSFNGGTGEGAKGNDGTSQALKNAKGGITYNEWSFAQAQKLNVAKIVNSGGGQPVELNAASAAKAVDAAKFKDENSKDLELNLDSIYGTKTAGAYPLMLATYEIACSKYPDADTGKAVKAFLSVAAQGGQEGLDQNGYVKLPKQFSDKLLASINAIQ
ncbi:phosphate ABC transporter substrate-binding protein PstS [Sciscionella sediminilitoris]|uniref:phosphate ABC transporter substrate-binding protein PstS n=1 Tax=Sciscionella sediminilitoris TaxID=1445613 RepID=UPI0004DF29E3|nr:phosphate ABC transporter substrate-binding protein PstS [Sciscionella sp. SE31]